MVTRTDCPCGKTDLSSAQMTMHKRSKAHQDWEATLDDAGITVEAVTKSEDHELEGILDAARNGEDIRHIAKMTRSIFAARNWPNEDHPGSIQDWLESHNIPTINVPLTPTLTNSVSTSVKRQSGFVKQAGVRVGRLHEVPKWPK